MDKTSSNPYLIAFTVTWVTQMVIVYGLPHTGIPHAARYAAIVTNVGSVATGVFGPLYLWTSSRGLGWWAKVFARGAAVLWIVLTVFAVYVMASAQMPGDRGDERSVFVRVRSGRGPAPSVAG
jgi:ABC-type tungstate transport system substrate-binding protein